MKTSISPLSGALIILTLIWAAGAIVDLGPSYRYRGIYEDLSIQAPFWLKNGQIVVLSGTVVLLILIWQTPAITSSRSRQQILFCLGCLSLIGLIYLSGNLAMKQGAAGLGCIVEPYDRMSALTKAFWDNHVRATVRGENNESRIYFPIEDSASKVQEIIDQTGKRSKN